MQTLFRKLSPGVKFLLYLQETACKINTANSNKTLKLQDRSGSMEGKVDIFTFHSHTEGTSLKGFNDMVSN